MKNKKCPFCEELKRQIAIGEEEKKHGYTMYLRACLFVKSKCRDGREHYQTYSKPVILRYCPSCGKDYKKVEEL